MCIHIKVKILELIADQQKLTYSIYAALIKWIQHLIQRVEEDVGHMQGKQE